METMDIVPSVGEGVDNRKLIDTKQGKFWGKIGHLL